MDVPRDSYVYDPRSFEAGASCFLGIEIDCWVDPPLPLALCPPSSPQIFFLGIVLAHLFTEGCRTSSSTPLPTGKGRAWSRITDRVRDFIGYGKLPTVYYDRMETRTRGQRATEQITPTDRRKAAEAAKNKDKVYPDDQLRSNVSVNQMFKAMYPPELEAPPPASPSQASPSGSSRLGTQAGSPSGSPRGKPRRPTRHCRQSAERRYWHYWHVKSIKPANRSEPSPGAQPAGWGTPGTPTPSRRRSEGTGYLRDPLLKWRSSLVSNNGSCSGS